MARDTEFRVNGEAGVGLGERFLDATSSFLQLLLAHPSH